MAVGQQISIGLWVPRGLAGLAAIGDRVGIGLSPAHKGTAMEPCEAASRDQLVATLRNWFGKWLESLRESIERGPAPVPRQRSRIAWLAAIGPISTYCGEISGFSAVSIKARWLLHSQSAFGIGLPVAGDNRATISGMRV